MSSKLFSLVDMLRETKTCGSAEGKLPCLLQVRASAVMSVGSCHLQEVTWDQNVQYRMHWEPVLVGLH